MGLAGEDAPPPQPPKPRRQRRPQNGKMRTGVDDPLLEAVRLQLGIRRDLATRLSRLSCCLRLQWVVLPPSLPPRRALMRPRALYADVAPFVPYRLLLLQHLRPLHFASVSEWALFAERQLAALASGLLAAVRSAPEGHTWGVQVVETVEEWEVVDTTVLGTEARMRMLNAEAVERLVLLLARPASTIHRPSCLHRPHQ